METKVCVIFKTEKVLMNFTTNIENVSNVIINEA